MRGFLGGLAKKGAVVEVLERVRQVGADKTGAKGSSSVYRISRTWPVVPCNSPVIPAVLNLEPTTAARNGTYAGYFTKAVQEATDSASWMPARAVTSRRPEQDWQSSFDGNQALMERRDKTHRQLSGVAVGMPSLPAAFETLG
jgi:hypothetical protein